jgi:hypothetical protein
MPSAYQEVEKRITAAEHMITALIAGKLSRMQENMEDILTSNVFGLMQYLPAADALLPFLGNSEALDGSHPLAGLSANTVAIYSFWPWIERPGCHPCEPDVMIRLNDPADGRWIVFVEAKFRCEKSSEEDESSTMPYDQLAREWDNLVSMAEFEKARPLLIYVTADIGVPHEDIASSAREFSEKRGMHEKAHHFRCAWLSWRRLSLIFRGAQKPALRDLCAMANHLSLCYFEGLTPCDLSSLADWEFRVDSEEFAWKDIGKTAEIWRFAK